MLIGVFAVSGSASTANRALRMMGNWGWLYAYAIESTVGQQSLTYLWDSGVGLRGHGQDFAVLASIERKNRTLAQIAQRGVHPAENTPFVGRCAASGAGLRRALQQCPPEQRHRLHHAKGHARRASAGDPCREESEVGGGAKTASDSSAAGCVKTEEASLRLPSRCRMNKDKLSECRSLTRDDAACGRGCGPNAPSHRPATASVSLPPLYRELCGPHQPRIRRPRYVPGPRIQRRGFRPGRGYLLRNLHGDAGPRRSASGVLERSPDESTRP